VKKASVFELCFSYREFFQKRYVVSPTHIELNIPFSSLPTQSVRNLFEFFVFAYWLKVQVKICQLANRRRQKIQKDANVTGWVTPA
jgi:hypothetical protein